MMVCGRVCVCWCLHTRTCPSLFNETFNIGVYSSIVYDFWWQQTSQMFENILCKMPLIYPYKRIFFVLNCPISFMNVNNTEQLERKTGSEKQNFPFYSQTTCYHSNWECRNNTSVGAKNKSTFYLLLLLPHYRCDQRNTKTNLFSSQTFVLYWDSPTLSLTRVLFML